VEEELDRVGIDFERNGLEKGDVVCEHLFIPKVIGQANDIIQMVVGEEDEQGCCLADVADENGQRLQGAARVSTTSDTEGSPAEHLVVPGQQRTKDVEPPKIFCAGS
jgi:hypothetical protein